MRDLLVVNACVSFGNGSVVREGEVETGEALLGHDINELDSIRGVRRVL